MKFQMISLDLMVALPIISAAILLLFSSFYSSQTYLTESSRSEAELLSLYYDSQFMASVIGTTNANYTSSLNIVGNSSMIYRVNATLSALNQEDMCPVLAVCRIVTVSSVPYMLEVRK